MIARLVAALLALSATSDLAAAPNSQIFVQTSIPTLDDFGLVAITLVVAIAGGFAARRRNRK